MIVKGVTMIAGKLQIGQWFKQDGNGGKAKVIGTEPNIICEGYAGHTFQISYDREVEVCIGTWSGYPTKFTDNLATWHRTNADWCDGASADYDGASDRAGPPCCPSEFLKCMEDHVRYHFINSNTKDADSMQDHLGDDVGLWTEEFCPFCELMVQGNAGTYVKEF